MAYEEMHCNGAFGGDDQHASEEFDDDVNIFEDCANIAASSVAGRNQQNLVYESIKSRLRSRTAVTNDGQVTENNAPGDIAPVPAPIKKKG